MDGKIDRNALRKALKMALFILIALEAAAFLVQIVSEAGRYLRMDIKNPTHQLIFAAIALLVGGYTYFRERMKHRNEAEDSADQEQQKE